ncbi:MAG: hypothetical protein JOY60_05370 [Burkholderiaceae bacterium]|nr:hypothetical protein [Burkholderiaceae bacterium]
MRARIFTFLVWALLAFSAVAWALKLLPASIPAPAGMALAHAGGPAGTDWSRLLGAAQAPQIQAADSRYKLLGVVSPKAGLAGHETEGVALISVDGAPPLPVRVGGRLDHDVQLLSLDARSATLGSAGRTRFTLNLVAAPVPATGSLPVAQAAPQPGLPVQSPPGGIAASVAPGMPLPVSPLEVGATPGPTASGVWSAPRNIRPAGAPALQPLPGQIG